MIVDMPSAHHSDKSDHNSHLQIKSVELPLTSSFSTKHPREIFSKGQDARTHMYSLTLNFRARSLHGIHSILAIFVDCMQC